MSILDSLGGYLALHTAKATLELQGATKTIIPNDVNPYWKIVMSPTRHCLYCKVALCL